MISTVLLIASSSMMAATYAAEIRIPHYFSESAEAQLLGQGWDLNANRSSGFCIESTKRFGSIAPVVRLKLEVINESNGLRSLIAHASIVNSRESLENVSLTESAERVLREFGPNAFRAMCGDGFAATFEYGGSIYKKASSDSVGAFSEVSAIELGGSDENLTQFDTLLREVETSVMPKYESVISAGMGPYFDEFPFFDVSSGRSERARTFGMDVKKYIDLFQKQNATRMQFFTFIPYEKLN